MDFGKNRVQYKDFFWQYYKFENFDTYFYKGGEDIAEYSSRKAREYIPAMERLFDFVLEDKLQLIIYNTHSDFKQSNIGLGADENTNIGGTTRIVGSKVFIYYEGDHNKLEEQIMMGIAQVIVNQMMYGGSIRDMVRSSALLSLPQWYLDGLVSFAATGWNERVDNVVRDGILSGRFVKFNRLEGQEAIYAGHSIWNYIAEVYGERVIPNILYMTRVSRNVESGFLFVLGLNLEQLVPEYLTFYQKRYAAEEELRNKPELEALDIKNKKERVYQQFKLSPDGKYAAYVTNQMGQYKLYLYNTQTGEQKRLVKGEHKLSRLTDYSYPVLAWHPNSEVLAYVIEKKGKLHLNQYFLSEKKTTTREVFQLEKIQDMDYSKDGKNMVLSAVAFGQTDLYRYYLVGNRQEKLTDDRYDDLYPHFAQDDNLIVFSSNRPTDTLGLPSRPSQPFRDIFTYHLKTRKLERITNTPEDDDVQPFEYGPRQFTYLSNKTGVINRFFAKYDSTIASVDTTINYRYFSSEYPLSNFNRNILDYHVNPRSGQYSALMYQDGKYRFYYGKTSEDSVVSLAEIKRAGLRSIRFINFDNMDENHEIRKDLPGEESGEKTGEQETYKVVQEEEDTKPREVDIYNYEFGESLPVKDNTPDTITFEVIDTTGLETKLRSDTIPFELPVRRNYNINFATDNVLTQVDNTYNNQFYQVKTGPDNINPGLSGYLKLGVSDLFEDYKIVGGIRLSVSLNNYDLMLSFQDLKKRLDRIYTLQRQTQRFISEDGLVESHTTYNFFYDNRYPLSEVAAIKAVATFRHDEQVLLTTDPTSLHAGNVQRDQAGLKLEYVFDNTVKKGLNLYNGTRYKFFAEYYQQIGAKEPSGMQVFGLDARHYEKIHRSMIAAFRLSASTSVGHHRVLYYMGGYDRWLFNPGSDPATLDPEDTRFRYQSQISPMRGFLRNTRNGNNFMMVNTEVRWPVFKYFADRPLRSDFLENFQVVAFGDIGAAWTGSSPYSDENQFNQTVFEGYPVSIRMRSQREPIIAGYGFGLRARLLGYFVRADWAWGWQDYQVQPRQFSVSLSLDF